MLAMDATNHSDLRKLAAGGDTGRLLMFRDLDPRATDDDRDVPDPYYGDDDGFAHVMAMVERTCTEIVGRLRAVLA